MKVATVKSVCSLSLKNIHNDIAPKFFCTSHQNVFNDVSKLAANRYFHHKLKMYYQTEMFEQTVRGANTVQLCLVGEALLG